MVEHVKSFVRFCRRAMNPAASDATKIRAVDAGHGGTLELSQRQDNAHVAQAGGTTINRALARFPLAREGASRKKEGKVLPKIFVANSGRDIAALR
jgi:hypothetical protein